MQTQPQPQGSQSMTTDAYTEQLSLWLDAELNDKEVAELQDHLDTCAHCRQAYASLRHIDALLKSAAAIMVAPAPEFVERVEARLAGYRPRKMWQIWLAIGALLGGTLLFFSGWALAGSLTLLMLSGSFYDAGAYNELLLNLIASANGLRFVLNIGALIVKTGFLAMQQPLFWAGVVLAAMLAWLWVRGLRAMLQRGTIA